MGLGVFDSGVGGLSVLRELLAAAGEPRPRLVYLADQAHCPYGSRTLAEVDAFSEAAAAFLRGQGAVVVVLACNTASAAALKPLRERHPGFSFVGMEPALKPAALETRTGVVGILATQATFQGELFASVKLRFGAGVKVLERPCPGLADLIERGDVGSPGAPSAALRELLARYVAPLAAAGADRLVLACTHYPWVKEAIGRAAGPGVAVVDPSAAVARQALRVWAAAGGGKAGAAADDPEPVFFTTGDPARFDACAARWLGRPLRSRRAEWREGRLFA